MRRPETLANQRELRSPEKLDQLWDSRFGGRPHLF
jgi:hypothetical protein